MRFLLLIIIVSSLVFVASSAAKTDHPVVELNESQPKADDPERAGYCAPVPMLRVGDESYGLFMDLYADDESRALYHSWGFTDAKIDPSTGAIYC